MTDPKTKLDFLTALGVFETKHSGRTLGEHLVKTHDMLVSWGCPQSWCDAGLFHSIYGTPVFKKVTTENRDAVREIIGENAENLAYAFCNLQPPRIQNIRESTWTDHVKEAMYTITAANRMEQGGRSMIMQYHNALHPTLCEKILRTDYELNGSEGFANVA